jgi:hypothetical protein
VLLRGDYIKGRFRYLAESPPSGKGNETQYLYREIHIIRGRFTGRNRGIGQVGFRGG